MIDRERGRKVLAHIKQTEARVAEAEQYIGYKGIEGPREHEDASAFCQRVAGDLRSLGMVVEAHEALQGRRYDDPNGPSLGERDSVLTGVAGALMNGLHGDIMRSSDGLHQVGDDLALGVVATNRDKSGEAIAAAFALLGPDAMDFLGGGRR
ncbi:MAG: hypothetical protein ABW167_16565 [Baekduia sp.]